MRRAILRMHFYYALLFSAEVLSSVNAGDLDGVLNPGNFTAELENCQTEAARAIKRIFNEQQMCVPSRRFADKVKIKLLESKATTLESKAARLERRSNDLILAMTTTASQKRKAYVRHPLLIALPGASVDLACESPSQPLSLCVWEHTTVDGQHKAIIVDDEATGNGAKTPVVDGITVNGRGLKAGKCGLNIRSLTTDRFGLWTCTLVSKAGLVLTGDVGITKDNQALLASRSTMFPRIYFVTWNGKLQAYSPGYQTLSTPYETNEGFRGVTYDFINDKIYWSRRFAVYRSDLYGNGRTYVLSNAEKYGTLSGLAFDWINVRIFVATYGGYILSCDARPAHSFTCVEILSSSGWFHGIAVDPIERTMYWTLAHYGGMIMKAGLDGSNPTRIVTDLLDPYGIAIDFAAKCLYWADEKTHRIQSSNLDGRNNQTVVQLPSGSKPNGMAVMENRIYWGTWGSGELQSSTKYGSNIQTHLRGVDGIHHLALVAEVNVLLGRQGTRVSG